MSWSALSVSGHPVANSDTGAQVLALGRIVLIQFAGYRLTGSFPRRDQSCEVGFFGPNFWCPRVWPTNSTNTFHNIRSKGGALIRGPYFFWNSLGPPLSVSGQLIP